MGLLQLEPGLFYSVTHSCLAMGPGTLAAEGHCHAGSGDAGSSGDSARRAGGEAAHRSHGGTLPTVVSTST